MSDHNSLFDSQSTRGISPVVGAILMISITLILAVSVGPLILGLPDRINEQPQMKMDFVYDQDETAYTGPGTGASDCRGDLTNTDEGEVKITIGTGNEVDSSQVTIIGHAGNRVNFAACSPDVTSGESLEAGDRAYVGATRDADIRVIWESNSGETTTVLGRWKPIKG